MFISDVVLAQKMTNCVSHLHSYIFEDSQGQSSLYLLLIKLQWLATLVHRFILADSKSIEYMHMSQRIEYFIVDLDGCVTDPFSSPDWELLSQLRALSDRTLVDDNVPKLSICTGRPAPYTEAVGQWLNVQVPVLFESGAGMLDLATQQVRWNPALPDNALKVSGQVKRYIKQLQQEFPDVQPESSKQIDAGFVCAESKPMQQLATIFSKHVANHFPMFELHGTDISISAIWPCANKGSGIDWFCREMKVEPANVAYIGDTSGDLPAIARAGISFTPQNGGVENKQQADFVTKGYSTAGVVEAWHQLIAHNQSIVA